MSLPPRLAVKLNDTLGQDAAGDLVSWLDEMRADRQAMRADFAELRQEMLAMVARITERLTDRLDERVGGLDERIDGLAGRMHAMEVALRSEISAVNLKVEQRSADLIRWSFVFWVSAVAAIATLAGVLRS